jgi:hypothetical protein
MNEKLSDLSAEDLATLRGAVEIITKIVSASE